MKYLLLIIFPISALALDPSLPVVRVVGQQVVERREAIPQRYGQTVNYQSAAHLWESDGWRQLIPATNACPDGYSPETSYEVREVVREVVTCAEAVKRTPPVELLQTAAAFRQILRLHMGSGAETNKAVTLDTVTAYFVQRRLTLPYEQRADDASDTHILLRGYEAILAWTGTGHIWEFPWEMLDE